MNCPECKKKISWPQIWRFTNVIEARKIAPCPICKVNLTWAKWPYRLVSIGGLLNAVGLFVFIQLPPSVLLFIAITVWIIAVQLCLRIGRKDQMLIAANNQIKSRRV